MKLTDFTEEQLRTEKFKRTRWFSEAFVAYQKSGFIYYYKEFQFPLSLQDFLGEDWELVKEPLRLEVGKKYRDRKGNTYLVVAITPDFKDFPVVARLLPAGVLIVYTLTGKLFNEEGHSSDRDLVEEVEEG